MLPEKLPYGNYEIIRAMHGIRVCAEHRALWHLK